MRTQSADSEIRIESRIGVTRLGARKGQEIFLVFIAGNPVEVGISKYGASLTPQEERPATGTTTKTGERHAFTISRNARLV